MNEIKPFCGWRYDPRRVDLQEVMAPPYDIVSPEEQEAYLRRSPYNVFHLELGRIHETDSEEDNRYTRARKRWHQWRREGILLREEAPALYLYRLHFSWQGKALVRRGLIGLVRLAPWESRRIRPHEKTFSKVTEDRLNLMRATQAQFSQIFCLYHDPGLESLSRLEAHASSLYTVEDPYHFRHEIARITNPEALTAVSRIFERVPLYIADGHHRYTTALTYMREMEERYGANPPRCFHYIMMYLCPFEEPGLLVLPTHRLLKLDLGFTELVSRLKLFGKLDPLDLALSEINSTLEALKPGAFLLISEKRVYQFSPRTESLTNLQSPLAPPLKALPVALFTGLLKEALNLKEAELKEKGRLLYTPWVKEIWEKATGRWFGFLLPPTPVTALEHVANAGLVMPHKSTFFFPKILTGTVFFEIRPDTGPPC